MGYTGGVPAPTKEEQALYGRDLFHDGNLRVAANRDYQTVDGIENYRRAIIRRLVVRPGEYRPRPNYGAGLGAYVKMRLTTTVRAEIVQRVSEQARLDRRTEAVLGVDVTRETFGDASILKVTLRVKAFGRQLTLGPFSISEGA